MKNGERTMAVGAHAINLAMLSALRVLKESDSLSAVPPELLLERITTTLKSVLPKALNRYRAAEVCMDEIVLQIERVGSNAAAHFVGSDQEVFARALKAQIESQEARVADTRARMIAQEARLYNLRAEFACFPKSVVERL